MVMKRTALFLTLLFWALLAVNVGFAESGKSTGNLYMRTAMSGSSLNISWIYLGNDGVIVKNPVAGANPIDSLKKKLKMPPIPELIPYKAINCTLNGVTVKLPNGGLKKQVTS